MRECATGRLPVGRAWDSKDFKMQRRNEACLQGLEKNEASAYPGVGKHRVCLEGQWVPNS